MCIRDSPWAMLYQVLQPLPASSSYTIQPHSNLSGCPSVNMAGAYSKSYIKACCRFHPPWSMLFPSPAVPSSFLRLHCKDLPADSSFLGLDSQMLFAEFSTLTCSGAPYANMAGVTPVLPGSQTRSYFPSFWRLPLSPLMANTSLLLIHVADLCHYNTNASPNATLSAMNRVGTWNVQIPHL